MKPPATPQAVIPASLVFYTQETAERKAFPEFSAPDRPRRLHDLIEPAGQVFSESFYRHLPGFEALRRRRGQPPAGRSEIQPAHPRLSQVADKGMLGLVAPIRRPGCPAICSCRLTCVGDVRNLDFAA